MVKTADQLQLTGERRPSPRPTRQRQRRPDMARGVNPARYRSKDPARGCVCALRQSSVSSFRKVAPVISAGESMGPRLPSWVVSPCLDFSSPTRKGHLHRRGGLARQSRQSRARFHAGSPGQSRGLSRPAGAPVPPRCPAGTPRFAGRHHGGVTDRPVRPRASELRRGRVGAQRSIPLNGPRSRFRSQERLVDAVWQARCCGMQHLAAAHRATLARPFGDS